jgi:hypothetical protein
MDLLSFFLFVTGKLGIEGEQQDISCVKTGFDFS